MLARGGGYGTPLAVYDYPPAHIAGFQDTTGKIVVDPAVVPGERTGIFLVAGQSLVCNNVTDGRYTPANAKVHNFNIYDRKTYKAVDPLLGTLNTDGNFITELGDMLISAGTFDRVILIPVGCGGTTVAMWGYSGIYNHRLQVPFRCLPLFGAPMTAVLWCQGEQDAYEGTTQSQYATSMREAIDTVHGVGYAVPIFVARESFIFGAASSAVQAAQASVVDNNLVFAGVDMDSIPLSERLTDKTHLNATGRHHAAALWQTLLTSKFG